MFPGLHAPRAPAHRPTTIFKALNDFLNHRRAAMSRNALASAGRSMTINVAQTTKCAAKTYMNRNSWSSLNERKLMCVEPCALS